MPDINLSDIPKAQINSNLNVYIFVFDYRAIEEEK
jgi:hypothetical protein